MISYCAGTILSDLSDHFINFIQLPLASQPPKPKPIFKREINLNNVSNFKISLNAVTWAETLSQNGVNEAFESFWATFSELYQLHFPMKKVKFNKNVHKINNYMTQGLIISRKIKLELCKKASKERSQAAADKYKKYRNIFNQLMRASKKLYFNSNFENHKKIQRKHRNYLRRLQT